MPVDRLRSAYAMMWQDCNRWVVYNIYLKTLCHLTTHGARDLCKERGIKFDGRMRYVHFGYWKDKKNAR